MQHSKKTLQYGGTQCRQCSAEHNTAPSTEQGTNQPGIEQDLVGQHVNHNFSAPGFIKDKNDNPPFFTKQHYTAEGPETPTSATR